MTDTNRPVPFAELASEYGLDGMTANSGRHRVEDGPSVVGRTVAGVVAGAALTGGAAMSAAPASSAQSVEAPFVDPAVAGQILADAANQFGINEDTIREYSGMPGMGSVEMPVLAIPGVQAVAPTTGPISSGFGPRWGTFHNGTDFAAPIGTPLLAAKAGTVVASGPASGYGLWIRIKTDDGYLLEYGHNNANYVEVGQRVVAGQVIGEVGNRGYSTGPHLHFGVQNPAGQWVDPVPYLAANGVFV